MATPDVEMHGFDSDNALSEPLDPDNLEGRSIVPDAYKTVRESSAAARGSSAPNATASVTTLLRPQGV